MFAHNTHIEPGLLKAVSDGDEKAFSEIFHQYRNRIYAIAFKLTGSEALAEEVLLDVFLKVWLKRDQLPHVAHFTAWLFTVTRNHIFNLLKQTALKMASAPLAEHEEYLLPHADDPAAILQEKEYRRLLQQAVDQLPSQQKKVYHLIKEHGMKREEAATELNLSPETVKRHLSEAMQFIRVYCLSHLGIYGALIIMKGLL
jgi:RNA polymerase sigma-70 factor (ECF subfamily)